MGTEGERELEELFASYVDRLNSGEEIDAEKVLGENPIFGAEILDYLEDYMAAGSSSRSGSNAPLGTLGDYTLRRQIGRGGMGVVYEAWQNSLDRRVALKVLPAGVAADNRAFLRFMKEAKTAAQLNHRNVVGVYGMGVEQNTPYFAMELVEGETLAQILAKLKKADERTTTPFGKKDDVRSFVNLAEAFADVSDGLQHAHSKGVVHRDIKPSNLILDKEGRLRILDFGLARLDGQESLTATGDFLGTPLYMSPEQARRKKIPVDHRTDIYSLGATLYEMLALRPPFQGKDHHDTLSQIIERDPVEPRKLNPRVPRDLETIVLKCLRKDPADRYGTAEALGQDLRRFVRGDPIEARVQGRWDRTLRKLFHHRWRIALAAMIAILIAAAVGQGLRWREERRLRIDTEYEAQVRRAALRLELASVTQKADAGESGLFWPMEGKSIDRQSELAPVLEVERELETAVALLPGRPDAWYHLARALLFQERWKEADAALDGASPPGRPFIPALILKARLLDRRGERKPSVALKEKAAKWSKAAWENAWIEIARGWSERKFVETTGAYGKLIEIAVTGEPFVGCLLVAHLGRGAAANAAKDYALAVQDYVTARFLAPGAVEPALLEARTWHLLGKDEIAERLFQQAYDAAARKDEVAIVIGVLFGGLGDVDKHLEWVSRITAPSMREQQRAQIYFDRGKWEEAESAALKAVELDARNADSYCTLWWIYEGRDDVEAKIEILEKGIQAVPDSYPILHYLGNSYRTGGRPREAIQCYERASRVGTNPTFEYAYIACCHLILGDAARASDWIEKAKQAVDPEFGEWCGFWNNIGISLWSAGRLDEAVDTLDRGIRSCSEWSWIHKNKGYALMLKGDLDAALESFHRAQGFLPWSQSAFILAAMVYELQNDHGKALAEYRNLLEGDPVNAEAHGHLADLLRTAREKIPITRLEEASASLEKVQARALDNPRFLNTQSLILAAFPDPERHRQAVEAALRGLDAAEKSGYFLRELSRTLGESVALLDDKESCPLLAFPSLPPYAAIDDLLGSTASGTSVVPCADLDLSRWANPAEPRGSRRLRYLQGLLLDRSGNGESAIETMRGLVAEEETRPEPLLALARLLRARGEPRDAERALRTAIESRPLRPREIWEAWLDIQLNDLKLAPSQVFAESPRLPTTGAPSEATKRKGAPIDFVEDVRWFLDRLQTKDGIRIHCGGTEVTASDGRVWGRDRFFLGGKEARLAGVEILGTESDLLYLTRREFTFETEEALRAYRIPLPAGRYRVHLHFAETSLNVSAFRRFDVFLQGKMVLPDVDMVKDAGFRTAVEKVFEVRLERGPLEIRLVPHTDIAAISAIEVERIE